jgi:hypothetical protein
VKVTSPVLTQLGKALAGQAEQEAGDAKISVPPIYLNSGQIPQPIFRQTGSATSDIRPISHIISSVLAMNASVSSNVSILSEGLWDIEWLHFVELAGVVADITSVGEFKVNVGNIGPSTLSRFRGDTNPNQGRSGSFRLSVQKGFEVILNHATTAGAGTSTQSSWLVLICSRIL